MRYILISITIAFNAYAGLTKMNHQYYEPGKSINSPQDKKIVLVGGCFDILHFGHMHFLEKAREAGDYLVVALEPDTRITNYKNRQPAHTQQERAHNLIALKYVDQVILLPQLDGFEDYLELVKAIQPTVIAITSNDPQKANKQKQADLIGAQLIDVVDMIGSFSSSAIYKQKMLE